MIRTRPQKSEAPQGLILNSDELVLIAALLCSVKLGEGGTFEEAAATALTKLESLDGCENLLDRAVRCLSPVVAIRDPVTFASTGKYYIPHEYEIIV